MMADDANQRRLVRGHGVKGKWHEAKLEAFEDPIVVVDARWQNLPQPWLYLLCFSYAWWCHFDKKWSLSKHETHKKINYTQYTSCLDEHMKAHMLEVYMAMMGNHFFPKNQMPLIAT
jgi:hypothetical protein